MTANRREIVSLTVTSVLPQARFRFRESQLVDKSAARISRTQLGKPELRESGEKGDEERRWERREVMSGERRVSLFALCLLGFYYILHKKCAIQTKS